MYEVVVEAKIEFQVQARKIVEDRHDAADTQLVRMDCVRTDLAQDGSMFTVRENVDVCLA